jgi:hypothetical protein
MDYATAAVVVGKHGHAGTGYLEETGRALAATKYLRSLKLKQVEQKILEYLHDDEPVRWEEIKEEETEPADSTAAKG